MALKILADMKLAKIDDFNVIYQKITVWFEKGKAEGFKYLLIYIDPSDFGVENDKGLSHQFATSLDEVSKFLSDQRRSFHFVEVLNLDQSMKTQFLAPPKNTSNEL